ncbi:hypothetical protein CXG81DRAFT_8812, partial [Caulochytrium protostelioides]
ADVGAVAMASRLDRLVLLLHTGSTPMIRSTAAKQLGEIQKQHPEDLYHLLARVLVHLRSLSWETRAAASQAIYAIAQNVAVWSPNVAAAVEAARDAGTGDDASADDASAMLSFNEFDVARVLQHGRPLLASQGAEFDVTDTNMDPKERLLLQKKQLKAQLGLANNFINLDFFDEADFKQQQLQHQQQQHQQHASPSSDPPLNDAALAGLSARERNRLKRMQKAKARNPAAQPVHASALAGSAAPRKRKPDTTETAASATADDGVKRIKPEGDADDESASTKLVVQHKEAEEMDEFFKTAASQEEWPFEGLCEQLMLDLFSPSWQVRHGAAQGLAQILRTQPQTAGMRRGIAPAENAKRQTRWVEDLAIRLLCVLTLERFSDFVGDHVIVPVRETAAQTLGTLLQSCDPALCHQIMEKGIIALMESSSVKKEAEPPGSHLGKIHAGLVGLKYWLATRADLVASVIGVDPDRYLDSEAGYSPVLAAILDGLVSPDEEIRTTAVAAIAPIAETLVKLLGPEFVQTEILARLWSSLRDLDDLSSSTAAVMDLLAKLVAVPSVAQRFIRRQEADARDSLDAQIALLFPFFRHTVTSVRSTVLTTLHRLVLSSPPDVVPSWVSATLLSHLARNFALEQREDLQQLSATVWAALLTHMTRAREATIAQIGPMFKLFSHWCSIIMHPMSVHMPMDRNLLALVVGEAELQLTLVDQAVVQADLTVLDPDVLLTGRMLGCKALGHVLAMLYTRGWLDDAGLCQIVHMDVLKHYLASPWAEQKTAAAHVIEAFYDTLDLKLLPLVDASPLARQWHDMVHQELDRLAATDATQHPEFYECVPAVDILRSECRSLLSGLTAGGISQVPALPASAPGQVHALLSTSRQLKDTYVPQMVDYLTAYYPHLDRQALLHDPAVRIDVALARYERLYDTASMRVAASLAAAWIFSKVPVARITPYLKPLMKALRAEVHVGLQAEFARSLARLLYLAVDDPNHAPTVPKVLTNLAILAASDQTAVPPLDGADAEILPGDEDCIVMTSRMQAAVEKDMAAQAAKRRRGANKAIDSLDAEAASVSQHAAEVANEVTEARQLVRRGAQAAYREICALFGDAVFTKLPLLREQLADPLDTAAPTRTVAHVTTCLTALYGLEGPPFQSEKLLGVAHCLDRLAVVGPKLVGAQHPRVLHTLQNAVTAALGAHHPVLRHLASVAMARMAAPCPTAVMTCVIDLVIPFVADANNRHHRQGAIECLMAIVDELNDHVIPYIVFFIVPVLSRMADPDPLVRFAATQIFATLVKLIPLEKHVPDPVGMREELIEKRQTERRFLGQLTGSEKIEEIALPAGIKAELRYYQKEGVSWLAFLARYGLHGILCDDMGLGKTLQSICILALDHHQRSETHRLKGTPASAHLPSLVVCPSTLTGHWEFEIGHFASFMRTLVYAGPAAERRRLAGDFAGVDVVITSYEVLRNDIDLFTPQQFNYCILDEGHVIKNPKTKLSKALREVRAHHRLLLSGTPIQNNVLELWALFDWLMPGFLGTEAQFNQRFGKPIQASRDAKSSSKEQEAGALALEALHKQVLPFLMRRMKEDVLDDLPPKIIQDYYCEMSGLQRMLYEEFCRVEGARLHAELTGNATDDAPNAEAVIPAASTASGSQHVFQALRYLRKLCNHPAMVVEPNHPKYPKVQEYLATIPGHPPITDIQFSPKLMALKQLLIDCGIGASDASGSEDGPSGGRSAAGLSGVDYAVASHRALIFCQVKTMLDLIQNELFAKHMPGVTFMRMDGSTEHAARFKMVQEFNRDASIDVLLLTTQVGGLGLNLTGADTVIFVEHDWNPSKDLQAMDRAHRIGQKRVVNVYRLITRGTLEEKIMGLQKFKQSVANSVVNADNAGVNSMDTEQILDLFSLDESAKSTAPGAARSSDIKQEGHATTKEVLEGLGGLWDESEYESLGVEEYMATLKS